MVTVVLKGVHVTTARLADGRLVEYHYAWKGKGAPRLKGAPGSPEYVRSYQEAHQGRKQPQTGLLGDLIAKYKASPEFAALAARIGSRNGRPRRSRAGSLLRW